ncbi:MAG: Ig-like domain-containing protein [Lachnospiraceae bacterium]|nr:Ig-like domain-containing protein [Lachnospiraceae bacterium]
MNNPDMGRPESTARTAEETDTGKEALFSEKRKSSSHSNHYKRTHRVNKKAGGTKAAVRRNSGASHNSVLKMIFTNPALYLMLAMMLSAVLVFYGNGDGREETVSRSTELADMNLQGASPSRLAETHSLSADTPQAGTQNPDPQAGMQNPDPQSSDPQAGTQNLYSQAGTQSPDPQSAVQDQNAGLQNVSQAENLSADQQSQSLPQAETLSAGQQNLPQEQAGGGNRNVPVDGTGIAANAPGAGSPAENPDPGEALTPAAAAARQKFQESAAGTGQSDDPVPVESVTISADTDVMAMCDTLQLTAKVMPKDAGNTALLWFSDDETIARVSQEGLITSLGSGSTVITAVSSNGITASFPIHVSASRKMMTLTVSTECVQNDKVGFNWTYRYLLNGDPIHDPQNVMVEAGKAFTLTAEIIDHDEQPDKGTVQESFSVDQSAVGSGFEITQEVNIQENAGMLRGNNACFVVTYRFVNAIE